MLVNLIKLFGLDREEPPADEAVIVFAGVTSPVRIDVWDIDTVDYRPNGTILVKCYGASHRLVRCSRQEFDARVASKQAELDTSRASRQAVC